MHNSFDDAPFTPKVVLAVVAHPDDIEFCAAGSVIRWIEAGTDVHYLILTSGCNGTSDRSLSPEQVTIQREDEQRAAAKLLGVKNVYFCDYQDCHLATRNDVKRDIVRTIRKVRPDTVITMDPTMYYSIRRGTINHSDHRAAGQATLDAVFPLSRDHLAFPELIAKEKLQPHKVSTILLVNYDKANFYVDISKYIDKKIAALRLHESQFPDIANLEKIVRTYARDCGEECHTPYAEAFIRLNIPEL